LYRKEKLERVGRGLYALPGADLTEHHTLAEAALRVPRGVICLLSALRFHDRSCSAKTATAISPGSCHSSWAMT
jgi:predicted transcriptional regulator of viral defense system